MTSVACFSFFSEVIGAPSQELSARLVYLPAMSFNPEARANGFQHSSRPFENEQLSPLNVELDQIGRWAPELEDFVIERGQLHLQRPQCVEVTTR